MCSPAASSSTNVATSSLQDLDGPSEVGTGLRVCCITIDSAEYVASLAIGTIGLRASAAEGVDQDQGPVRHLEGPLDLAAEVGVPGVSMMLIFVEP